MKHDIKRFFFKNIGIFLIAAVSVLYIIKGLYTLEESGRTILQILGDGILSSSVGFIIGILMRQTGISYGNDDTELIKARSFHARLLDKASEHIELLDDFCVEESLAARRTVRQRYLSACGLKYSDCFSEDGAPKDLIIRVKDGKTREERAILRKKKRALARAIRLRTTPLTPASLSVDESKGDDPFNFGRTQGEYLAKRIGRDVLSKIAFGLIFGYYAIRLTDGAGMEDVLWASFQIAVYLIFGASQMIQAYMFVKTEIYSRIMRKTDMLQKFFRFVSARAQSVDANS